MREPPLEYEVCIRWRREKRNRIWKRTYFVIARNPTDALDFGRFRFWKTHVPEVSRIDDVSIKEIGVLLIDDGWGDADALGAHGAKA